MGEKNAVKRTLTETKPVPKLSPRPRVHSDHVESKDNPNPDSNPSEINGSTGSTFLFQWMNEKKKNEQRSQIILYVCHNNFGCLKPLRQSGLLHLRKESIY